MRLTALCRPGTTATLTELKATLQRLHRLRDQMRDVVQQQNMQQAKTIPTLRATMRALLHDLDWHPEFLRQA